MQPNTIIESLGIYLPPRIVDSKEVIQNCRHPIPPGFFERATGIQTRRVAGTDEFSIDLAIKAVEDCLAHSKCVTSDIDLLICCNISRYDEPGKSAYEPSTAIKLQKHFNLNHALAFDISNACAGIFTGIYLADAYLHSGAATRVLLVSGEYITHLTDTAQKEITGLFDPRLACLTLGDSGVAMLLERGVGKSVGFHAIELFTLGAYSSYCLAKTTDAPHGGAIMLTQSVKLAGVALREGTKHLLRFWERHPHEAARMNYVIPHQTSLTNIMEGIKMINAGFSKEVLSRQNTATTVTHFGNTSTTSHFIALYNQILNNRIKTGDTVAFAVIASGVTLGAALYTLNDLPERIANRKNGMPEWNTNCSSDQGAVTWQGKQKIKIVSIGLAAPAREGFPSSGKMSLAAAESCLQKCNVKRSDIGLLLYCGIYRDEFLCEPAVAAILAGELSINPHNYSDDKQPTLAFDILNGSLGLLNACQVAAVLIETGRAHNALVAAAEIDNNRQYCTCPDNNCPHKAYFLGIEEAGAALLLTPDPDSGFSFFYFQAFERRLNDYVTANTWLQDGSPLLHVHKAKNLEQLYIEDTCTAIENMLVQQQWRLSDFDYLVPPQISHDFIYQLTKKLSWPIEKTIDVTSGKKDLFTNSIPFAFESLIKEYAPAKGQKALIIGVGAGIQVGCAVYEF